MSKFDPAQALRPDKDRYEIFQDLMPHRVQNILLASSLYDSFIFERDGQLHELFLSEFLDLNLRQAPGLNKVMSGADALATIERRPIDLVISSFNLGDMNAFELAREVRKRGFDVPVVLMGYDSNQLKDLSKRADSSEVERVFLWQGDVRILLAIVKYVEDRLNLRHDVQTAGVQVIILIEDSIRYYSSFLPLIYVELFRQSQRVISEGANLTHKILRMRARPKILLCSTFEEAWEFFSEYHDVVLGVISDIQFPRRGEVAREAGVEFARKVRDIWPDVPILLQSSRAENAELARSVGAAFALKGSPTLLNDLRRFMIENFAFGDFVFRLPDGQEVDRARNLRSMLKKLRTVPTESISFHAARNHFSNWLKARTEFVLAEKLRVRKAEDFSGPEEIRTTLIDSIDEYRKERQRGIVSDFDPETFDPAEDFARIGGGSLGGKARGLAFVRYLLHNYPVDKLFDGVRIFVPPAVVLGTDIFDQFLEENLLREFVMNCDDEAELEQRILAARFPERAALDLAAFLNLVRTPMAVRSSSLLEDSQFQPFTGVYETFMLPNNHPDLRVRLDQLLTAVKRVYLSTFSQRTKEYIRVTPYRLEQEKMAVIIMKVVGETHGERFYPDFAGVARSFNFYPIPPAKADDGVTAVALGLGRTVVEGGASLQFCPSYPRHVVQFSSVQDVLANSQRHFWALAMRPGEEHAPGEEHLREEEYGLDAAEEDGTLGPLASVYSPENNAVYDGLSRKGVRLVSFAAILKHNIFPLAQILEILLELGNWGMNSPVEIEYAVNISTPPGQPKEFGFLQMRPLVVSRETEALDLGEIRSDKMICRSKSVLGNGRIELHDLVFVDYHSYKRDESVEVAGIVARYNRILVDLGLPYALFGVGRWGSKDPWLGIPVNWEQISNARVIVEAGFKDFSVAPSQGTHFFQNLTSFNIGYFTISDKSGSEFVDWEWLKQQPAHEGEGCVRWLQFEEPIVGKMNGKEGVGIILKPGAENEMDGYSFATKS